MDLNEYQRQSVATYIRNPDNTDNEEFVRIVLGLVGESGEIAEITKKVLRGDATFSQRRSVIAKEIGDVMWYIATLCTIMGLDLTDVAQSNIDKLASRKERGVIQGSGSDR